MGKFFMMVGVSGSGKTYYAHSICHNGVVLSSDDIRKELYGDENEQGNPAVVFSIMMVRTKKYLAEGKDVIYDATNLVRKRRVATLQQLPKNIMKIAIVVCTPILDCYKRNDERERHVPREVIEKQLKSFEMPVCAEGFEHITIALSGIEPEDFYLKICDQMNHDNPYHERSVGQHIRAMVKAAKEDTPNDELMIQLCKYHDLGKAITKTVDEAGIGHFYGHEHVSAYLALGITGNKQLAALIGEHMKLHNENFNIEKLEKYFTEEEINYLRRLNYYDRTFN